MPQTRNFMHTAAAALKTRWPTTADAAKMGVVSP